MFDIFESMKRLTAPCSPSGYEAEVSAVIAEMAKPYGDEIYNDAFGNLFVLKKGRGGKKIMVSAHMDSIGIMVTKVDEKGYARFTRLGWIDPCEFVGTRVRFANGALGVVCREDGAEFKELKLSQLYVDLGAESKEDCPVKIGDVAVYDTDLYRVGKHRIVSRYHDNRISCLVSLIVLSQLENCPNDVIFVFSAQEEVGTRGAAAAAFGIEPDIGLAVDVTDTGDLPGEGKMDCYLNKGAAIKVMDSSVICTPWVVKALIDCADAKKIPYQMEILEAGGTDTGAMQRSRAGVASGAVSIPTRYIHSPAEMVDQRDVEAVVELVREFLYL